MINAGSGIKGAQLIVLGLAFKENCTDLRNPKVADVVRESQDYGCEMAAHDPIAEPPEVEHEYGITLTPWGHLTKADAIVTAVSHREYPPMALEDLRKKLKPGGVFVDIKAAYGLAELKAAGFNVWRL